ncbi:MAG: hypothetical protein EGS44_01250 [Akkermansia muciniphila]|nr:hypothetical protein [Akkermansia muciniphila]
MGRILSLPPGFLHPGMPRLPPLPHPEPCIFSKSRRRNGQKAVFTRPRTFFPSLRKFGGVLINIDSDG